MISSPTSQNSEVELFALRGFSKRPATPEEIQQTHPFFKMGNTSEKKFGILFIHGFTATPASLRGYAEWFSEKGYTVSLPLLPGHGTRPSDLLQFQCEDWIESLLESYEELSQTSEKIVVIGLSLGATLVLHLALRRPDIRKLYLLAPSIFPNLTFKIGYCIYSPLRRFLSRSFYPHVGGDVKDKNKFELGYGKTPLESLKRVFICIKETEKILPKIKTETQIFQGKTDHVVPAKKARVILDRLGATKKGILWLDNSYHEIPRDGDAEMVRDWIANDLKNLD